jgi:glutamine amidotransferase
MIAIIDYGSGNIAAISSIYKSLGISHNVVSDTASLPFADKYILPGVGNFDFTMNAIRANGILTTLNEQILILKKPILGICVGMQLMADSSEEGKGIGLGWIKGKVSRIKSSQSGLRLPHMGWNSISIKDNSLLLLKNIDPIMGFYFLHSYRFVPQDLSSIMATTEYGDSLVCGISNHENIFGVQFHPEKSHNNGVQLFKNFSDI